MLRAADREGASAFDQKWEAVSAIVEHDPPLYLAGGMATVKEFLSKHVGETERTARRYMRVARYASPAEEVRFGTTKLDSILDYFEAKAGQPLEGRLPVDFAKVRLSVKRDDKDVRLGLEELTLDELRVETRKLRRSGGQAPAKASPIAKAIANVLKGARLGSIGVRVAGGKVWLGGIPLEAWRELVDALRKVELP